MAFNINAHVILQGPKNIGAVTQKIQTQLQSVNANVNVNIPRSASRQLKTLSGQMNNLNATTKKLNTGATAAAGGLNKIQSGARGAGNAMFQLGRETALTFKRFAAAGILTATVFRFLTAVSEATGKALEFERGLVKLRQITGATRKDLQGLKNTVDSLARSLGQDANEILEVSQIFAQTGQSIRQIKASITAVARSSLAPTFGEMKDTAEGLIAALNQFGIAASESEAVLGSLNRVSKKFAVESQDIIAAIRRAGGVFAITTRDFEKPIDSLNQFIAVFTAVRSTTRESAETIATGLRTIFTRLQRRGTIQMLDELGIKLTDTEGKFVGLFESFRRLSTGLKGLVQEGDAITLSAITEELGGIRQVGKLIPAIKNFNKAEAAFREAQRGAVEGLGKDVSLGLKPLIKQFEQLRERFGSLIRTIADSATFKTLAKVALTLGNAFLSISEALTPLLPLLFKFATLKIGMGVTSFFRGFGSSFAAGGGAGGAGSALGRGVTGGPRVGGGGGGGAPGGPLLAAGIKQLNVALNISSKSLSSNTGALAANTRLMVTLSQRIQQLAAKSTGSDTRPLIASVATLTATVKTLTARTTAASLLTKGAGVAVQQASKLLISSQGLVQRAVIANNVQTTINTKAMVQLVLALRANAANKGHEALILAIKGLATNVNLNTRALLQASIKNVSASKAVVRTMLVLVRHLILLEAKLVALSTAAGLLQASISSQLGRIALNTTALASNTRATLALRAGFSLLTASGTAVISSNALLVAALQKAALQIRQAGGGSFQSRGGGRAIRRKRGGFVPGRGNGDTVPALLEPGEFVIRKSAAQAFGAGNLHKVNKFQVGRQVLRRPGRQPRRADAARRGVAAERQGAVFGAGGKDQTTEVKALGLLKTADAKIDALPEDDRYGGAFLSPEGANRQLRGIVEKSAIEAELKKSRGFQILSLVKPNSPTQKVIKAEIADIRSSLVRKTDFSLIARSLSQRVSTNIENDIFQGVRRATKKGASRLAGSTRSQPLTTAEEVQVMRNANIDNVIGNLFEMTLLRAGVPFSETKDRDGPNAPFDFPTGLGGLGVNFGSLPPNIQTDAKTRFTASNLQSFLTKVKNVKGKKIRRRLDTILDALDAGSLGMSLDDFSTRGFTTPGGKKSTRRNVARQFLGGRKAKGGTMTGATAAGTDTIPALLTPGEYVVNKKSAKAFGYGNLSAINKFAGGGPVRLAGGSSGSGLGGSGGGAGIGGFLVLQTLLFDIPLLSQALKDSAEGIEGAGSQITIALTSLAASIGFLAFEFGGIGALGGKARKGLGALGPSAVFGGGAGASAFARKAKGGTGIRGFFGRLGAGLSTRGAQVKGQAITPLTGGKGSLLKGLSSRPTGLAAGFIAPAAAAAIGFAIAKPVSRALTGVSGRIEEATIAGEKTGVFGTKGESAAQAQTRGAISGGIKGASIGGALGFVIAGPIGAAVGASLVGTAAGIIGAAKAHIEQVKFGALIKLNSSAKDASDALKKLAEDEFVTAGDIKEANREVLSLFQALESSFQAGKFAQTGGGELFLERGFGKRFGANILSALFNLPGSLLSGGGASRELAESGGRQAQNEEFVGRSDSFFSEFLTSTFENTRKIPLLGKLLGGDISLFGTDQERRGDRRAGQAILAGEATAFGRKAFDEDIVKASSDSLANAFESITEIFVLSSNDSEAAIQSLQDVLNTLDTDDPIEQFGELQAALKSGKLGEAGKEAADKIALDLGIQLNNALNQVNKSLSKRQQNLLSGVIQNAGLNDPAVLGDADKLRAAQLKALEDINIAQTGSSGAEFRGLQKRLNDVFETALKTTNSIAANNLQLGILNVISKESARAFDAMSAALTKLARVFTQAFNVFDIAATNLENRINSLLSGEASFELPKKANPFKNLDLEQLDTTGITDSIKDAFLEIEATGGAGAAGAIKNLEAAPAFAANIDQLMKDAIFEVEGLQIAKGGQLPTTAEILNVFENRLPADIADSPIGKAFLRELESTLTASRQAGGGDAISVGEFKKQLETEGGALEKFGKAVKLVTDEQAKILEAGREIAQRSFEVAKLYRDVELKIREFAFKKLDIDKKVGEITGTRTGSLAEARGDLQTRVRTLTGGAAGADVGGLAARQRGLRAREQEVLLQMQQPGQGTNEVLISRLADVRGKLADNTEALKTLAEDTTQLAAIQKEIADIEKDRSTFSDIFKRLAQAQEAFQKGDFKGGKDLIRGIREDFRPIEKLQKGIALDPTETGRFLAGEFDPILKLLGQTDAQIQTSKDQAFKQADPILRAGLKNLADVNIADGFPKLNELEAKKKEAEDVGKQKKAALQALENDIIAESTRRFQELADATDELRLQLVLASFAAQELRAETSVQRRDTQEIGEDILVDAGGDPRKFADPIQQDPFNVRVRDSRNINEEINRLTDEFKASGASEADLAGRTPAGAAFIKKIQDLGIGRDRTQAVETKVPVITDVSDKPRLEAFDALIKEEIDKLDTILSNTADDASRDKIKQEIKRLRQHQADAHKLAIEVLKKQEELYEQDVKDAKDRVRAQAEAATAAAKARVGAGGTRRAPSPAVGIPSAGLPSRLRGPGGAGPAAVPAGGAPVPVVMAGGGAGAAPVPVVMAGGGAGAPVPDALRGGRGGRGNLQNVMDDLNQRVGQGVGVLRDMPPENVMKGLGEAVKVVDGAGKIGMGEGIQGGGPVGFDQLVPQDIQDMNAAAANFNLAEFQANNPIVDDPVRRERLKALEQGANPQVGLGGVDAVGRRRNPKATPRAAAALANLDKLVPQLEAISKKREESGIAQDPQFARRLEALQTRRDTLSKLIRPNAAGDGPAGFRPGQAGEAPPPVAADQDQAAANKAMGDLAAGLAGVKNGIAVKMADPRVEVVLNTNNLGNALAGQIEARIRELLPDVVANALRENDSQTGNDIAVS